MKFFPSFKQLRNISEDPLNASKENNDNSQIMQYSQDPLPLEQGLFANPEPINEEFESRLNEQDDLISENNIDYNGYDLIEGKSNNLLFENEYRSATQSSNINDLTILNFQEKYSQLGTGVQSFKEL